jgi:hypothetical protein
MQNKNRPADRNAVKRGGCFYPRKLCTSNILGVRALFSLDNLEGDFIADSELVECDAAQILRMKEKVFLLAFLRNKTKSPIRQCLDFSIHN